MQPTVPVQGYGDIPMPGAAESQSLWHIVGGDVPWKVSPGEGAEIARFHSHDRQTRQNGHTVLSSELGKAMGIGRTANGCVLVQIDPRWQAAIGGGCKPVGKSADPVCQGS